MVSQQATTQTTRSHGSENILSRSGPLMSTLLNHQPTPRVKKKTLLPYSMNEKDITSSTSSDSDSESSASSSYSSDDESDSSSTALEASEEDASFEGPVAKLPLPPRRRGEPATPKQFTMQPCLETWIHNNLPTPCHDAIPYFEAKGYFTIDQLRDVPCVAELYHSLADCQLSQRR